MKKIIIYSGNNCPYCVKAKDLLKRKNLDFEEIIVDSEEIMNEMIAKSNNRRSIPQIFIDGKHIGGCDDLHDLNSKGKL